MRIQRAKIDQLAELQELVSETVRHLRGQGIMQWDHVYPDLDAIKDDILSRSLYVAVANTVCVGTVCIDENQEEAYQEVSWTSPGPSLVVHRLCVAPSWQGQGVASQIMDFVETHASEHGYASIRLDVYTGNDRAVEFYRRRGYVIAGSVSFPRRELPFYCMEIRTRSAAF